MIAHNAVDTSTRRVGRERKGGVGWGGVGCVGWGESDCARLLGSFFNPCGI